MAVLGATEARMENPMPCTCKDTLSILRTFIITLCSAVNILQHLEAIWGLGSVPKPTGGKKLKNQLKPSQQKKKLKSWKRLLRLLKQLMLKEASGFLSLPKMIALIENGQCPFYLQNNIHSALPLFPLILI